MKSVREWIFSQLVSNSLVSSRPMAGTDNIFHGGPRVEEFQDQASADISVVRSQSVIITILNITPNKRRIPWQKLRISKLISSSIIQWLGHSQENLVVAKVLYRIHLATLIRAGESDLKRVNIISDRAQTVALEQEAIGLPELDFSCRILVLGKTGVGKSATINSIFDQAKTITDAFRPATNCIQEVVGIVNGVKVTFIDTPGLLPSSISNVRRNRKIMLSVKRYIRKSPPDIVLYFEWLDLINVGYSDLPILKLITEHYIHQIVSDLRLENPVLLVEIHPQCKRNARGEKILPNGQYPTSFYAPIFSSILRNRSVSSPTGRENVIDETLLSDTEEEDEYDQLPSIRILTKSQFEQLTKSQKKDYLDELDYREILYLKKQLREEYRRQQESRLSQEQNFLNNDHPDLQRTSPEAVFLPDMAVPLSFDSDCSLHRYCCLVTNDHWLVRPVLDPQGWDHDVGFDGINLETAIEMKKNVFALVTGQMSKDKQDFSIQSECGAAYVDPSGPSYSVGLDLQSSGKDLICTVHGNTKLRNLMHHSADCVVSVTSFGKKYFVGTKIEDTISVGKRLRFVINAGCVEGSGQVAYGGSCEATFRGREYPVINDSISLTMTILSFNEEMVLGGSVQSEFKLSRSLRVLVNANLNSRKMGQICIKTSSSEHLQIALLAVFSAFKSLLRRKGNENMSREAIERG
ncbi:Translocase of chloroplast 90 chloroplastic [Quillaja saponaria]|uniref:Translocase of chloroplast 90 chloroplastic n=1 Tax=Quillaja saponaria TaxID=32244 RepID=A0AAD7QD06_QUISA|nr:Translocase of chloroplast 90 chloroplastic [Quillaja saponaria]